ncbi:MAG: 4-alpha-glucanotransferase, partial [Acidimicrobiales bacterium]
LDAVPELAASPEALRILASAEFASVVTEARRSERVAYGPLHRLRRSILEALADSLLQSGAGRRSLEEFAATRPELLDYARFRAVGERHGRTWRAWGPGAAEGLASAGLADPAVRYHLCGQWLADRQLREAARHAPIYGDLPVGVHPDGFDPFHQPEAFAPLARGGAPPDPFFVEGQDWAFPPLHPRGLEAQGYAYVIDTLRVAFANAAALRVDHVMGLHRLFWIPQGFDAPHGAYVRYDAEVLHALVALEAHRVGAVVVGEDLGTVEDHVRATMAREGMLRSWVLEFKTRPDDPLPEPPEQCIASWATHDVPRFAAYYRGASAGEPNVTAALGEPDPQGRDERAQWRAALAADLAATGRWNGTDRPDHPTERAALEGCLGHLAASAADLVQVDLADLWGEREQENRPGTGTEAGNWTHRAAVSLEAARTDPDIAALLALVDRGRELPAEPQEMFVR